MSALSLRRTARLTRWNTSLLVRNRLAFVYAVVMPLLPLLLLFSGDRGDATVGAGAITTMFMVAGLFPVYYNVLAQFVSRRDELVLKRLRTGETRDGELLASIALPGALTAIAMCSVAVPVTQLFDQPLPVNPVAYVALMVLSVVMFVAFAYWTAAWTRSAEAAQLTSLPVILLASVGPFFASMTSLSDGVRDAIAWTPGAAMSELVRSGWFGFDGVDAKEPTLALADTWSVIGEPLLVLVVWTAIAVSLARRSMRWEPRS